MRVDVMPVLPGPLLDPAWAFYRDVFDELRILAVNRHLMHRHEFEDLMADKRIDKYVAHDDAGEIIGLAAMTSDLSAVPLVSPEYFRHHWPELYAENRLFYVLFVGAMRGPRGRGVFVGLLREMYRPIEAAAGRAFVDVCTHNEEALKLPEKIAGVLTGIAGHAVPTRVDSQSFWMYEFA